MSNESKLDLGGLEDLVKNVITGIQKLVPESDVRGELNPAALPTIKLSDTHTVGNQIKSELTKVRQAHASQIDKRRTEMETALEARKARLDKATRPKAPVVVEKEGVFVVSGRVVDKAEGLGLPNVTVKAFDMDRKYDDQLGETRTDKDGYYTITYAADAFEDVFDAQPETYIEILDAKGDGLYTSPRSFVHKAGAVETINAEIDGERLPGNLELAKKRTVSLEYQRTEVEKRTSELVIRDRIGGD